MFDPLLKIIALLVAVQLRLASCEQAANKEDVRVERLLVMTTVRNEYDESFKRFNRSIETYNLDLSVLRWPTTTTTGDSQTRSSQLNLIKRALATHKSEPNLLIMIVDSENSILNGGQKDILSRFTKSDNSSRVVFATDFVRKQADNNTSSLILNELNAPRQGEVRLNADAYIGFAPALWDLFNQQDLGVNETKYFEEIYSDEKLRNKLGLRLDEKSELFQSLAGSSNNGDHNLDLRLELDSEGVDLRNLAHNTEPIVILGEHRNAIALNSLGNYLAKSWTLKDGCRYCEREKLVLPGEDSALPSVLIGIFIEYPTPFLWDFFDDFIHLNYPKDKIHLILHNSVAYHKEVMQDFLKEHGSKYASQQVIESSELEWKARDAALGRCVEINCDYYLSLDGIARLEVADALRILIESNRTIVAPLLNRPTKLWSNFWGAMTDDGFYARSHDYVELVKRDRVGLWNVPHVMNAYLLNGRFIRDRLAEPEVKLTYRDRDTSRDLKPVLAFTENLRASRVHQFMVNTHEFGHLIDPSSYNLSLTHPDFYQLAENVLDWERTYLHENYSQLIDEEDFKLEQPCQDVFWFPLVNDKFCSQIIEIMETFGQWSGGTNNDPRIEGGYESVPTRDIHMKQVGLHDMWLLFLRDYIMPIQLKEYIGYEHDPPRANLAFVVRYHPAEQASLQPHHDSSTYTVNIALNTPNVDYQGGGCRFERYNCSVTESRRGWALMHPGRLTHYHEGLPVTNGTRYIMVTFVDP